MRILLWHVHGAWTTAFVHDGHVVRLAESPFDRRKGMASVKLDTAGAASWTTALRSSGRYARIAWIEPSNDP